MKIPQVYCNKQTRSAHSQANFDKTVYRDNMKCALSHNGLIGLTVCVYT